MSRSVNIIGAGGHSRAVVQLLRNLEYEVLGVYDNSFRMDVAEAVCLAPLTGKINEVPAGVDVVIAVGGNVERKSLFERFKGSVLKPILKHPASFVEGNAVLGDSTILMAFSYVGSEVCLGDNLIINSGAIIEHEARVGSHSHISVNATVCGRVSIGEGCFIGAGSVIKDKVKLGDNIIIGAGATVVNDILLQGTYVGNPLRKIK